MNQVNHWKTEKGKETLYNVFHAMVKLEEERRKGNSRYPIRFTSITLQIVRNTGKIYKNAYVYHALNELARLGFIRMNTYAEFRITRAGWEFWNKRKQIKGVRA